jgi:hypothetical protein
MDPLTKTIIRFPSQVLQSRLEMIHKCLLFISAIPSEVLNELCKFTTKMGINFLRLLVSSKIFIPYFNFFLILMFNSLTITKS